MNQFPPPAPKTSRPPLLPDGTGRPLVEPRIDIGPTPGTPEQMHIDHFDAGVTRLFDPEQTPVDNREAAMAEFARDFIAATPAKLTRGIVGGARAKTYLAWHSLRRARSVIEYETGTYGNREPRPEKELVNEDMLWSPPEGYGDEHRIARLDQAKTNAVRAGQEEQVAGAIDRFIRQHRTSGFAGWAATVLESPAVSIPLLASIVGAPIGGYLLTGYGKRSTELMQIIQAKRAAKRMIAQEQNTDA